MSEEPAIVTSKNNDREVSLDGPSVEMSPVHDRIPEERAPPAPKYGNAAITHPSRAKGSQQMSVLGYGGGLGVGDISVPRMVAFFFFGGGEMWFIPLVWSLLIIAIFVTEMCLPSSLILTEFVGMAVYRLSVLCHTLVNLLFGYCLTRDHVIDFYIRRCAREGAPVRDMLGRLDFFVMLGVLLATILTILHSSVYSASEDRYMAFETLQSVVLFYPSFFISALWTFIVFNKYRSVLPFLLEHCNPGHIASGKCWALLSDTLRDNNVVSSYWRKAQYGRLLSGLLYSSFILYQFYSIFAATNGGVDGVSQSYAFGSLQLSSASETTATYALFLGVEFCVFYGYIWFPMVVTGWVNDKICAHILEAVALPIDFDLDSGTRDPRLENAEMRRHQLVLQLDVYKSVVGFTLGVGTVTANLALTWGVAMLIVMYAYAVVHNII